MLQRINQTDKQKLKMYMKLKKRKLAKMLIQCNKILDGLPMTIDFCSKPYNNLNKTEVGDV